MSDTNERWIAFDWETYPIVESGKATTKQIPLGICMTWASLDSPGERHIAHRADAVHIFKEWAEDDAVHLVGHNVTFDMLVSSYTCHMEQGWDMTSLIWGMYRAGRVHDTIITKALRLIFERGECTKTNYKLDYMAKEYANMELTGKSGGDAWRMRYNELDDVPLEDWPEAALEYALTDAEATARVYNALKGKRHGPNEYFQLCGDLAFGLTTSWGIMCDPEWAGWIYDHNIREMEPRAEVLRDAGVRIDGVNKQKPMRELFAKTWRRLGKEPMMTDSGKNVSLSSKAVKELESAGLFTLENADETVEIMRAYSEFCTLSKQNTTYLEPMLDAGDRSLCSRLVTLISTGRSSCRSPNFQNIPAHLNADEQRRKENGDEGPFGPHIRGGFVPRDGRIFMVADYSQIEMASLAQVMAAINGGNLTPMGEMLNEGRDPHLHLLASYWDTDYSELYARYHDGDEEVDWGRFLMKGANYGFGGMASPKTYQQDIRKFGVAVDIGFCEAIYNAYHDTYPGVKGPYLNWLNSCKVGWNEYLIPQLGPGGQFRDNWRKRRCNRLTQAANTPFQGLVGDGCKKAAWEIQSACWEKESSPLYGDRMVLFVHDEFCIEIVDENRQEKADEFVRLAVDEGMDVFIPDVEIGFDVNFMEERWGK